MKLLQMVLPLTPQPYKNIITFFLSMLKNVDSKEELVQIGEILSRALADGKMLALGTPDEVKNHPAVIEAYLGGSKEGEN